MLPEFLTELSELRKTCKVLLWRQCRISNSNSKTKEQ